MPGHTALVPWQECKACSDPFCALHIGPPELRGIWRSWFRYENAGNSGWYPQAKRAFRKLRTQCGLLGDPPPRLHDLRHNYASECLARWRREGKDIQTLLPVLSAAMGHVNPRATQRYIHIDAVTLLDASGKIRDRFIQPNGENQ